jgi:hypothetical protein
MDFDAPKILTPLFQRDTSTINNNRGGIKNRRDIK